MSSEDEVRQRLNEIAEDIAQGADPNAFRKELDELLETQMETSDEALDAVWENTYRNRSMGAE